MKLHKLSCPNCNGILDMNIENKEYIFCPYCGQKFFLDNEKKEYTVNQNINIKKDININKNVTSTNRYIDDAEVEKVRASLTKEKMNIFAYIFLMLFMAAMSVFCFWMADSGERATEKAKKSGLISAGDSDDYEGENYELVVEQLETLGFENISVVDLDDAGIALWKSEKVESVSVGGDTSFSSDDYFEPDETVIVKYH